MEEEKQLEQEREREMEGMREKGKLHCKRLADLRSAFSPADCTSVDGVLQEYTVNVEFGRWCKSELEKWEWIFERFDYIAKIAHDVVGKSDLSVAIYINDEHFPHRDISDVYLFYVSKRKA